MKKILYAILITLLIALTITSRIFAQESPQWSLPEEVKARLGKGAINQTQYSPDSTRFAVATSIGIWLYNVRTGKELNLFPKKPVSFTSVAFHPDGQMIAAGGKDGVWLWELKTDTHLRTLTQLADVYSVAFSPDGETITSGQNGQTSTKEEGDGTISLWNVRTGALLHTIRGDNMRGVGNFTFSPDGQTIVGGNRDSTIDLWDVNTAKHKKTLSGHTDHVDSIAFRPDGLVLVSGSLDGTVLLWEIASLGRQVLEPAESTTRSLKDENPDINTRHPAQQGTMERDRSVDVRNTARIRPNLGRQNNTNNFDTLLRQSGGNPVMFDGKRSGLFLGMEIGAGVSMWKYKEYYYDGYRDSSYNWIDNSYTVEYLEGSPAFTMNFKVGYGSSEQTLFYITGGLVTSGILTAGRFGTNDLLVDLGGGLGVMHFPEEDSRFYYHGSLRYILSGYGRELGTWDTLDPAVSLGVSGGIGYELFSGLNLNATLDYYRWDAEPSDRSADRWNVFTFSITFSPHLY